MQNLCFNRECTISGYRTLEKCFATNAPNLFHSTQNDVSECFGTFGKPLTQKIMQILCFEPSCTISGYRTSEKKFRYERTQSTPLDPKRSLRVFRSILQTIVMKNYAKWYRTPTKTFAMNAPNLLH